MSLVFDFADIRSRMLGDDKPARKAEEPACTACEGGGWVQIYSPMPPAFGICERCFNPDGHPCP